LQANDYINSFWFKQVVFLPNDAMLAWYMLSPCVCSSVHPSVTSRHCTKTTKCGVTQTTPYLC